MTVQGFAGALDRVLEATRNDAGHAGCAGYGPPVLVDMNVVCACGVVVGELVTGNEDARPVTDEMEQEQRTHGVLTDAGLAVFAQHADPLRSALEHIDPTLPYGPDEVNAHLLDAATRLERGLTYEAGLVSVAHQCEMEYKLAYAEALASLSGGDGEQRKARALLACRGLYERMMLAQQVRDAMKATTHSLRSVLSGYQSVAKSVNAVYGATNQTAGRAF